MKVLICQINQKFQVKTISGVELGYEKAAKKLSSNFFRDRQPTHSMLFASWTLFKPREAGKVKFKAEEGCT